MNWKIFAFVFGGIIAWLYMLLAVLLTALTVKELVRLVG